MSDLAESGGNATDDDHIYSDGSVEADIFWQNVENAGEREYIRRSLEANMSEPLDTMTIIFGDGALRAKHIRKTNVDPLTIITANFPELISPALVRDSKTVIVIRYPDERWSWVKGAYADKIAVTEELIKEFRASGKKIIEVKA